MTAAIVVALTVMVGLLAVMVVGLLRSHAEILRALHELGIGEDGTVGSGGAHPATSFQVRPGVALPRGDQATSADDLVGVDPWGDPLSVAVAGAAHRTLLVFLSTGCLTCQDFWKAFAAPDELGLRADVRPVIVVKDATQESMPRVQELAPEAIPVVATRQAWESYGIPVAPYFVLVDGPSERIVGEGAAATWEQVRDLLNQALDDLAAVEGSAEKRPAWRRDRRSAALRLDQIAEGELRRAGITPGHPSLYGEDPPPRSEGRDGDRDTR